MDYFDLLHKAQKNNKEVASKEVRCYSTSFSPPKKVSKSNVSGANIQKFLARKEEEERQRLLQEKKKREELLALRALDKKAQKRVQVMLKKTKSANKSVMEDAIDNVNTADTLAGPQMCDDDDYGYVSQEASALYEKLMSKYQNIPAEKSKAMTREVKDINAIKDRVKAALRREEEEELNPHRKRKRKSEHDGDHKEDSNDGFEEEKTNSAQENDKKDKEEPKKVKKKMQPPPVDFFQLLKIAEQKQHEPIIIEKKVPKDDERPMTMKQKLEYQREMERKNGKKSVSSPLPPSSQTNEKTKSDSILNKRIPKKESNVKPTDEKVVSEVSKIEDRKNTTEKTSLSISSKSLDTKSFNIKKKIVDEKSCSVSNEKAVLKKTSNGIVPKAKSSDDVGVIKSSSSSSKHFNNVTKTPSMNKMKPEKSTDVKISAGTNVKKNNENEMSDIDKEIEMLMRKKALLMQEKALQSLQSAQSIQKKKPEENEKLKKPKDSEKEVVPKKILINNNPNKPPLQTKINNVTPKKDVPPVSQKIQAKPRLGPPLMKKPLKRRVIDSESEYDSELDDFIDDGPEENMDYSKHIKEIFGYDKSRYAGMDDDECEVASFRTQMIEEKRSAKIGLLEDLADIQREKEEKARATMKKKQKLGSKR